MALPSVVGTWTHSPNNRITYVSLNDTAARALYGIKNFLVGTMGFTLKYTCDGTTGPTSSSDHTDRLASQANCTTRGASTSAACSFFVVTDGNGVDYSFSYIGSTDDVFRVAYSATGVYLPAGTATFQPTATDEAVGATAITMVGTTTSGDRVYHMQATADKKNFRWWMYRSGTMQRQLLFENVTSTVTTMSFSPPFVFFQNTAPALTNLVGASQVLGTPSSGVIGAADCSSARINAVTTNVGGTGESFLGQITNVSNSFSVAAPELQGGCPLIPVGIAASLATRQGKIGNRIDVWVAWCSGLLNGDVFGSKQFVVLGSIVVPADGTTVMVYT